MISPQRLFVLNDKPVRNGRYVFYWMQASQRSSVNHALEHAVGRANQLGLPLLVGFGLTDDYPESNARHYVFMLQGLRDVQAALGKRRIRFVLLPGDPREVAIRLSRDAAMLVCDRGYLRHQKRWRDEVADRIGCRVEQVESDVVVPVETASDRAEFAARTVRPKIHRLWDQYLVPIRPVQAKHPTPVLRLVDELDAGDPETTLQKLRVDRSVDRSPAFIGGQVEARRRLRDFIARRLNGYEARRREPALDATSHLAPYLHFGQISPLEIALAVQVATAPPADRSAFLEELVVRRELAINFVHYHPHYDSYDSVPAWARRTLEQHRRDPRPSLYTLEQRENARTHDPYWNAAQREMTLTGFMHNSMRMYWGKKIIEWKRTPEEAFADALYLNNKYFLCGRDPASYANVAWLFGLHDRPWAQRPIFGTIRYMNDQGLRRKFDMEAYVRRINALPED
jgi:deoxyribodipyrimidine photo-lyase